MTGKRKIIRAVQKVNTNLSDVPPRFRANLTDKEMKDINRRYMKRYAAAIKMEQVLVDVLNGIVDREKIEAVLEEWRVAL